MSDDFLITKLDKELGQLHAELDQLEKRLNLVTGLLTELKKGADGSNVPSRSNASKEWLELNNKFIQGLKDKGFLRPEIRVKMEDFDNPKEETKKCLNTEPK